MTDTAMPEAIKAQQQYDALDVEVQRLADLLPSSTELIEMDEIPEKVQKVRDQYEAARAKRLDALDVLLAAKSKLGDAPLKTEAALRKAARGGEPPAA
ncbi:hypothetical protein DMB42_11430 [Nonomuraea sp. WAC 01424]|uniref:hypothetical protein n=1 Tax=Nonomuraea sp. WAC 01424 TaxID=2203200 RepID=UPI000F791AE4|nr:hypothetical protein [Nonomuraea sp. WAC 01424]RSN12782.1 hypothetical protein DMB42_11430 [Nonomuraea sp. WAC 01424]